MRKNKNIEKTAISCMVNEQIHTGYYWKEDEILIVQHHPSGKTDCAKPIGTPQADHQLADIILSQIIDKI